MSFDSKAYARKYNKALKLRRKAWISSLKDKPCVDCGKVYPPCVMDFDHVRGPKLFSIGTDCLYPVAKLIAEMAKCELVCSNCHRIRTHITRKKGNNV
jgi:hypothetical protein